MKRRINSRYYNYCHWDEEKYKLYDYERYGLLNKIISNKIISTENVFLKVILDYVEKSLIYAMKYTDILRNFKNVRYRNR